MKIIRQRFAVSVLLFFLFAAFSVSKFLPAQDPPNTICDPKTLAGGLGATCLNSDAVCYEYFPLTWFCKVTNPTPTSYACRCLLFGGIE